MIPSSTSVAADPVRFGSRSSARPSAAEGNARRAQEERSGRGDGLAAVSAAQLQLRDLLLGDVARLLAEDDHAEDVVGRDAALVDGIDDPTVVHDADPVGQVEDVVDVVADQEDADPL